MTERRIIPLAALAVAGLLVLGTGCGSSSKKSTAKRLGAEPGGVVNTTSAQDSNIPAAENSNSINSAGEVPKMPKGIPGDIRLPKGLDVTVSTVANAAGGKEYTVAGTLPETGAQDTFTELQGAMKFAGYQISADEHGKNGSLFYGSFTATKGKVKANYVLSDHPGSQTTTVTVDAPG